MASTKIASNKNTLFSVGPKTAVPDVLDPTLAQLNATTNVSEAVKWDGYDFNIEASDQDEDRALTDAAGAATRGYENFGGSVAFFTPPPGANGIYRDARNIVATPHTELVAVQRDGYAASAPFATGQVVNVYHVITDAKAEERGDKNRYYTIDFKPKGFVGVNRIIPSAVPTAVTITGTASAEVGESTQLHAAYEGNDITVGAQWRSSDESVAVVTPHGIVIGISNGTADITATYPGSAAGDATEVTIAPAD